MQNLKLVTEILGIIATIIGIVSIFFKPWDEIKAYAGAIGFAAAIALCFLPIKISEPDAQELNCGSVVVPQSVQDSVAESSGATNQTADLINLPLLAVSCQDERRKVLNIALPIGIFSLLVLIENIRKVRRAKRPNITSPKSASIS